MPGKYTQRVPAIVRECEQCGSPFKVWISQDRKARVKFCSRACFHVAESMGREERVCEQCGKVFTRPLRPSDSGVARRFCTHPCYIANKRRDDLPWAKRFWLKVNKTESCWLWIGGVRRGYGDFIIDWKKNTHRVAHRLSWEMAHGLIPEGILVLHNCPDGDNPLCVRPDHLFLGTQKDNIRDMVWKGRHPLAKITPDQAREIKDLLAAGVGPSELAHQYGMTRSGIRAIQAGRSWKHL